jgi:hypothetical protein
MPTIGFDYASVDGNILPDFARARAAGARIGVVRSIYGRAVKGQSYAGPFLDPTWNRDHARVRDSGIILGTYMFLCAPKNGVETPPPELQAHALIDYVGHDIRQGDLPPFVDVEEDSTLPPEDYFRWIVRACKALRDFYGAWPGLYTSARVWAEHLNDHTAAELINCPLWIAKPWPWPERTPIHLDGAPWYTPKFVQPWGSQWFLYQYQGDATGWPGFTSTVDASRFNTLAIGAKSGAVAWVQRQLNAFLTDIGNAMLVPDGDFGAKTESALRQFQRSRGLVADGVYGVKSHAMLAWLRPE